MNDTETLAALRRAYARTPIASAQRTELLERELVSEWALNGKTWLSLTLAGAKLMDDLEVKDADL